MPPPLIPPSLASHGYPFFLLPLSFLGILFHDVDGRIILLSVSVATWSTRNEYNCAGNVDNTTKVCTCFSQYLSMGSVVFRDPKLQTRQGCEYEQFDVSGRTFGAEMLELLTTTRRQRGRQHQNYVL